MTVSVYWLKKTRLYGLLLFRGDMNKKHFFWITALIIIAIGACFVAGRSGFDPIPFGGSLSFAEVPADGALPAKPVVVHLYFADHSGTFLIAEKKSLGYFKNVNQFGRALLKALISGPTRKKSTLLPLLPEQTKVRAFFVTPQKIAYVDFSRELTDQFPGGCNLELLAVYSVVNTLVLNSDDIDAVKLMAQGKDIATLAGHIATEKPLHANMLLVR